MIKINHLSKSHEIIEKLFAYFYRMIELRQANNVFDLLSPNLRCLCCMDQHKEKYQSAFKFGRKLFWMHLFDLKNIKTGSLETIVMLCYLSEDADSLSDTHKEEDFRYSAYKIQLVFLDQYWFINEIDLYNEFWETEFKEYVQSQRN